MEEEERRKRLGKVNEGGEGFEERMSHHRRPTPPCCHRSPPSLRKGELRGRPIGLGFWEGGVG